MSALGIDRRQVGILSERYLDVLIGDPWGVLLLLVQAPLIAVGVGGVWGNVSQDTLTMYFVLCLSAFFLGAANSAREIVKERALYLRERMYNLSAGAYLLSKFRVQLILIVIQCVLLAGVTRGMLTLRINVFALTAVLLAVALAGTAVGLMVSSWVSSPDQAVAMVPLVVIPQILFSDFVVGEGKLSNWTSAAHKLMPVKWGYEVLRTLRADKLEIGTVLSGTGVLATMVLGCFLVALLRLVRQKY